MERSRPDFIAFDVETSNQNRSSICQIGMVVFKSGVPIEKWSTLIDPEEDFLSSNIDIHGITPEHVHGCLTFPEIYPAIKQKLSKYLSVSHTDFDTQAIKQSVEKYKLDPFNIKWLDTCEIAQSVWPHLHSHSLNALSNHLKLPNYKAHDALDDSLICGHVFLKAFKENQVLINKLTDQHRSISWGQTKSKPRNKLVSSNNNFFSMIKNKHITKKANPKGALFGEVIVFTGELNISRSEATQLAANAGCEVKSGITKKTTLLVVGEQDLTLTKGRNKSTKQHKAEEYIAKGVNISILSEGEFLDII